MWCVFVGTVPRKRIITYFSSPTFLAPSMCERAYYGDELLATRRHQPGTRVRAPAKTCCESQKVLRDCAASSQNDMLLASLPARNGIPKNRPFRFPKRGPLWCPKREPKTIPFWDPNLAKYTRQVGALPGRSILVYNSEPVI